MLQPKTSARPRFFSYPPRQRWVPDAPAYNEYACRPFFFSYPPRQRWVPDAPACIENGGLSSAFLSFFVLNCTVSIEIVSKLMQCACVEILSL